MQLESISSRVTAPDSPGTFWDLKTTRLFSWGRGMIKYHRGGGVSQHPNARHNRVWAHASTILSQSAALLSVRRRSFKPIARIQLGSVALSRENKAAVGTRREMRGCQTASFRRGGKIQRLEREKKEITPLTPPAAVVALLPNVAQRLTSAPQRRGCSRGRHRCLCAVQLIFKCIYVFIEPIQ